jgi:hypothetical protein
MAADGRSRSIARSRTTHSGVPAMSSAAMLESTSCSATATNPLPPTRRNSPHSAAVTSWLRVIRNAGRPRDTRRTTVRIVPASRNRPPIARNGGMLPTTYLIAR